MTWSALSGSDMEEFDSEDFSTSEEDEDYVPSGKRSFLRRVTTCPAPHVRRAWLRVRGPSGLGGPVAQFSIVPAPSPLLPISWILAAPATRNVCTGTSRAGAPGGLTSAAASLLE